MDLKLACVVDVIQTSVSNVCEAEPNWILVLDPQRAQKTPEIPLPVSHIIFLFSPVTANTFCSGREWFDHMPAFFRRESCYFNLGFDCFESWINLFLRRNQFKRSQNARSPLASGLSSREFFEQSRRVLTTQILVQGWGSRKRKGEGLIVGYVETGLSKFLRAPSK